MKLHTSENGKMHNEMENFWPQKYQNKYNVFSIVVYNAEGIKSSNRSEIT